MLFNLQLIILFHFTFYVEKTCLPACSHDKYCARFSLKKKRLPKISRYLTSCTVMKAVWFQGESEATSTDCLFIPVIRLRRVCFGASLSTHFIIMKQTKS